MPVPGQVTRTGTAGFADRHSQDVAKDHFRGAGDLMLSSVGMGTYLGEADDQTDILVTQALERAVRGGINLIDTAINYRFERAEKCIGRAIENLIYSGEVSREELLICTKGGFVPVAKDADEWFEREYVKGRDDGIQQSDLVGGMHCLHPAYIYDQIKRSRANLGTETIDVYYLHNPEAQLGKVERKDFYDRLRKAFEVLEAAVSQAKIACWGLATWSAFRTQPDKRDHLDLGEIVTLAEEAAGGREHHLRFIQLPFNLAMPEALLATQQWKGQAVPVLEIARRLDLSVVASASICQAQVIGQIPDTLAPILGKKLSDAQRALQFTRSSPGFVSALVGMKQHEHVEENLALCSYPPLDAKDYLQILNLGSGTRSDR